jgi:hypothetical protein
VQRKGRFPGGAHQDSFLRFIQLIPLSQPFQQLRSEATLTELFDRLEDRRELRIIPEPVLPLRPFQSLAKRRIRLFEKRLRGHRASLRGWDKSLIAPQFAAEPAAAIATGAFSFCGTL